MSWAHNPKIECSNPVDVLSLNDIVTVTSNTRYTRTVVYRCFDFGCRRFRVRLDWPTQSVRRSSTPYVCVCVNRMSKVVDKDCRRLRLRKQLKILPIPTVDFGLRVPHGSLFEFVDDLKYRSAP